MRREQEGPEQKISISGTHSLQSISQGSITGTITSLDVPQVKAGEYIDIDIAYKAYNPNGGAWLAGWWKVFIVAKDSEGNKEMVKDATVKDDDFSDSGSWRLWEMPNKAIRLEVRLCGHDEVKSWDWAWWPKPVS